MPEPSQKPGFLNWTDLTVPNADKVSEFYQSVIGWIPQSFDMGKFAIIQDPAGAVRVMFEHKVRY